MDKEIIKVIDENGVEREAEIVLGFENNGKKYAIYTFNELDDSGMNILYSSIINEVDGEVLFEKINEEDWNMVKKEMNEIVQNWKEQ